MTNPNENVTPTKQHAPKCPKLYAEECTCDGYHTFAELYEHRILLFIALCRNLKGIMALAMHDDTSDIPKHKIWRSRWHSDGDAAFHQPAWNGSDYNDIKAFIATLLTEERENLITMGFEELSKAEKKGYQAGHTAAVEEWEAKKKLYTKLLKHGMEQGGASLKEMAHEVLADLSTIQHEGKN